MDLPIIHLSPYLDPSSSSETLQVECQKAASALITYGALIVHDPRVSESDNSTFLDLLEDYFAQPASELKKDERPELSYQIGVTLEGTEKPKCAVDESCQRVIERLDPADRPLDIMGHEPDPKCRFFWRMAEMPPYDSQFPGLNAPNVVPDAPHIKERWEPVMDRWGTAMKEAVTTLSDMLALGLGLDATTFSTAGRYGPHLLAPTASYLSPPPPKDTILAGFHTDLNFITIHGRSRYPGLNIWARNTGKRIPVKIPPPPPNGTGGAYLLVQAGKQLEHLTGGLIKAGYHEVVINSSTLTTLQSRTLPNRPSIRISSTFFWHLASDYDLAPIPKLAARAREMRMAAMDSGAEGEEEEYPSMKVGVQVQNELKHIALMT